MELVYGLIYLALKQTHNILLLLILITLLAKG